MSYKMNLKLKIVWMLYMIIDGVYSQTNSSRKKVCVIGAGPSGLASIKNLAAWPEEFDPIGFERNSEIGGQWVYTDNADVDEHGLPVHSGIYKYLRTNIPKQLIGFSDYTGFQGVERTYVKHQTFFEYIKNYTRHFNLHKYIKLNTLVEKVSPVRENEWVVQTRDLNTNQYEETLCDAVMVCIGNFHTPNIPNISGIESFSGRVLHSHAYRRPEEFADQIVVILGASFSGTDIANELSSYAKTVYLSHRHHKVQYELPSNMIEVPGVVAANGNQFILSNGSQIIADSIIFCTGYLYVFPFFDANVGINIDKGKYIHPLYKHFINVNHPTMAIIELPLSGISLRVAGIQAYYFTALLQGSLALPSREEMLEDAKLPPGMPESQAHQISHKVLDYFDELAEVSGADLLPQSIKSAFRLYVHHIMNDPLHFKEYNWVVHSDGRIELFPINVENIH